MSTLPRLPCPVCKTTTTIESLNRETLALMKQGDPHTNALAELHFDYGIVSRGRVDPDKVEPLKFRVARLDEKVEDIERGLLAMETCASCGVIYRPATPSLLETARQRQAEIVRRYPLDALARARAEE